MEKYNLPLRTDRLALKDFVKRDWQDWLTLRNLPETREYNQYTEPLSSKKGKERVETFIKDVEGFLSKI